MHGQKNIEVF